MGGRQPGSGCEPGGRCAAPTGQNAALHRIWILPHIAGLYRDSSYPKGHRGLLLSPRSLCVVTLQVSTYRKSFPTNKYKKYQQRHVGKLLKVSLPLLHAVLVSMSCLSEVKGARVLISTYQRLVICHHYVERWLRVSLNHLSSLTSLRDSQQDQESAKPLKQPLRAGLTSHSPSRG